MDNVQKRKAVLWTLWALIVPPGLYLIYQYFPPPTISLVDAANSMIEEAKKSGDEQALQDARTAKETAEKA
ncbi:hypothetical protein, partial [Planomicrobium okeanokoites]|uniref:hypothetical protein n=1 Tax=Planomicrobium okeanokoites TaxID=244 RepID=UPI003568B567